MGDEFRCAPGQHYEQSYQGQVSVAVSAGLNSDLNETDCRHKHSEEPKPANREIGMFAARKKGGSSHNEKKKRGNQYLQRRPCSGVWIKHREMIRPKHVEDVMDIRHRGISSSRAE